MRLFKALLLVIIFSTTSSYAGSDDINEEASTPCNGIEFPNDLHLRKLLFELPTYDEHIVDIEHEALRQGVFLEDIKVMTAEEYKTLRDQKIADIKSIFGDDCKIVSKEDYKKNIEQYSYEFGYILQESLEISLIVSKQDNHLEYTSFHLTDIKSLDRFTLIDPSDGDHEVKCLFQKDNFEYRELLALL